VRPARRGHALTDHLAEQQRVDVAAAEHHHGRRAEPLRVVEHRGHAGGAGGLDHLLGALRHGQHGA
jgi:hypothetical protein